MGNVESGIGIIDPAPSDDEDARLFEPLGPDDVQQILSFKRNDPVVPGFHINGNLSGLGDGVWTRLGEILGQNEFVERLTIFSYHCSHTSVRAAGLHAGIRSVRTIRRLYFEGVDLQEEESMHALAPFLTENPSLETVRFNRCGLGPAALAIFADALLNRPCETLEAIHLQGNRLGNIDLDHLVRALNGFRGLTSLNLKSNGIGQLGCRSLARLLENQDAKLELLDLSLNDLTDECVEVLAGSLVGNSTLRRLNLDLNDGIKSAGWSAILRLVCGISSIDDMIGANHALISFGYDCNSIAVSEAVKRALGAEGADRLRSSLCANASSEGNPTLAARCKIVWSLARGDLSVGRASVPVGAVPNVLAWTIAALPWMLDCGHRLLRYRRALHSGKELNSIYRILRSDPTLVTRPGNYGRHARMKRKIP